MCYTTKSYGIQKGIEQIDGMFKTRVQVPADSIWFDGHFPEIAILPGVAQLDIVVKVLSIALEMPVRVKAVNRVRFKQAIMPGESIEVQIRPKDNDAHNYGFRLLKQQDLVCSGLIALAA